MHRRIEEKVAELTAELWQMVAVIARYEQDLDNLRVKAMRLDDRLAAAKKLAAALDELGMDELVRMCNTPCSEYVPLPLDRLPVGYFEATSGQK